MLDARDLKLLQDFKNVATKNIKKKMQIYVTNQFEKRLSCREEVKKEYSLRCVCCNVWWMVVVDLALEAMPEKYLRCPRRETLKCRIYFGKVVKYAYGELED